MLYQKQSPHISPGPGRNKLKALHFPPRQGHGYAAHCKVPNSPTFSTPLPLRAAFCLFLMIFSFASNTFNKNVNISFHHVNPATPLKGLFHAIWYIFKKLNGVFSSHQLNSKINGLTTLKLFPVVCCCGRQGCKWIET